MKVLKKLTPGPPGSGWGGHRGPMNSGAGGRASGMGGPGPAAMAAATAAAMAQVCNINKIA